VSGRREGSGNRTSLITHQEAQLPINGQHKKMELRVVMNKKSKEQIEPIIHE